MARNGDDKVVASLIKPMAGADNKIVLAESLFVLATACAAGGAVFGVRNAPTPNEGA